VSAPLIVEPPGICVPDSLCLGPLNQPRVWLAVSFADNSNIASERLPFRDVLRRRILVPCKQVEPKASQIYRAWPKAIDRDAEVALALSPPHTVDAQELALIMLGSKSARHGTPTRT
jgi:hypothetical protein